MLKEKKSYYTDSGGVGFPEFNTLVGDDLYFHENKIKALIGCGGCVFKNFEIYGRKIESMNPLNGDFKLSEVFGLCDLSLCSDVFLNWGGFDAVDVISFESLSSFFYDIWFPGADDIYLYDESFSWVLNVTHYSAVLIVKG